MEPFLLLLLLMIRAGIHCHAKSSHSCAPSTCDELRNISYPFRLKDDPKGCGGDSRFVLACEDNRTMLSLKGGKYQVKSITFTNGGEYIYGDMVVVDVGLRRSDCSSLPLHQLMSSSFSVEEDDGYYISSLTTVIIVSCSKQVRSPSHPLYIPTEPCIAVNGYYSYAIIDPSYASDIEDSCTVTTSTRAADYLKELAYSSENRTISYHDVHNAMADGFNLSYNVSPRMRTYPFCFLGFRYGGKRCMGYYYGKYICLFTKALCSINMPVFGSSYASCALRDGL